MSTVLTAPIRFATPPPHLRPILAIVIGLCVAGLMAGIALTGLGFWYIGVPLFPVSIAGVVLLKLWAKPRMLTLEIDQACIRERSGAQVVREIRWTEPHTVWINDSLLFVGPVLPVIPAGTHRETIVRTNDGRSIALKLAPAHVHTAVRQLSTQSVIRMLEAELRGGQDALFGPITLNPGGIVCGGDFFQYTQVKAAEVRDGKVVLNLHGRFFATRFLVSDVPNVISMMTLIDKATGQGG